jgi:hypothetical protein
MFEDRSQSGDRSAVPDDQVGLTASATTHPQDRE